MPRDLAYGAVITLKVGLFKKVWICLKFTITPYRTVKPVDSTELNRDTSFNSKTKSTPYLWCPLFGLIVAFHEAN